MKKKIQLQLFLDKSREREYIRLPFSVDADTESISIRYCYPSSFAGQDGPFVIEGEPCTIDLAVMMPDGRMAGSSGSDRSSILISPLGSSAGFQSCELPEGTWHIIAGAYHIPANGVAVEYEVEVTPKERRLFKGDTHVHTTASDGILEPEEAAPGVWDWISLYLPIIITAPRMTGFLFMKISRSFRGLNGLIIRGMPVFWAQNRLSALLFLPLL